MSRFIDILRIPSTKLADLSVNCRESARLQSEALDRRLPLRHRLGLRIHLLLCKWCRRYGRQISLLHSAVHQHNEAAVESIPQKLSDSARERIRRNLRDRTD